MNDLLGVTAGAVAGVSFIGLVWYKLTGCIDEIDKQKVNHEVCAERHRRVDETLSRLETTQKEILNEVKNLPEKINHR